MERDRRKEVHTVVALSNSEGQTAGGTRKRQQRRALATTPQGAGRVGVTKKAKITSGQVRINWECTGPQSGDGGQLGVGGFEVMLELMGIYI